MDEWQRIVEGLNIDVFSQVLTSLFIIISLWLLNLILLNIIERKVKDLKSRYSWKKSISYSIIFIGIFLVSRVWFEGIQTLATFLGLLSAGLAIALKDLIVNLAGWIFIFWRKPFNVGNRIQIGENAGDVIDLRPFSLPY